MNTPKCPECGGEHFTNEAIRADAIDRSRPDGYFAAYGHWFNECADCGAWSLYREGKNLSIPNNRRKPKRHSEPPIE